MAIDVDMNDVIEDQPLPAVKFRWARYAIGAIIVLAASIIIGFFFFVSSVETYKVPDPNLRADGIVVLTGGVARLDPAVGLLRNKRGEKLLISGVHEDTSAETLQNLLGVEGNVFDCCVDIDREALDTVGNAVSTEDWVRDNGFSSIIVVTNDYHMPRSLLEIERRLPDRDVIAFPVSNPKAASDTMEKKLDRYRVLAGEYVKYMMALGRAPFLPSTSANLASISAGW